MGPSRHRIRRIACVLGALVCATGAPVQAGPAPHRPVVVSGKASNNGGLFTASNCGAVIELPSRARLQLSPNAALRIFPVPQLLALTPGSRSWTWSFALQAGRVDVEVPQAGHSAVLASMGKLSGIVTLGHSAFRVEPGEATAANLEGELRTLLGEHWQTVPLGWLANLDKDDANATAKPGLPSPMLTSGQRMWFAPSESVSMHGFQWTRVDGADHYELRVRNLADAKVVDQRSTTTPEWNAPLTAVEPGRYSLALRSIDARGMEGSWSPEAEIRVIGVVLPAGAYRTDKAIFLGAGQQVRFTNTDGLEMTYQGAGRYFPAALGAGLYRGSTTIIGFRMPGVLDTAVARLEPRSLYAEVKIGPQRAVWPRDPISIDIQLKSKTGEIPPFLQVVPKVTLGVDPVDVSFEQTGNSLHAVLPPSSKPGPWIVRVDVADQYGVPLGHDFLEIAAQPHRKARTRGGLNPGMAADKPALQTTVRPPASEPPVASSN